MDLFIDTSAYTLLDKGHPEAGKALRSAKSVVLPVIVVGELLYGFELGTIKEKNLRKLEQFISSSRVHVVEVNYQTCERYAQLYAYLRRKGRPLPVNDIWLAALCWQHAGELLTADRHFLDLPQLIVRHLV